MIRVLKYCTLCYVYPGCFRYGYGIAKILLLYRYVPIPVRGTCTRYLRTVPRTRYGSFLLRVCNVKNARTHHSQEQNTV